MVFNETVFIALFFIVWLTALTVYLYRMSSHYGRLTKGVTSASLQDVLGQILSGNVRTEKRLNELVAYVRRLDEGGLGHIQRIGIVRYNPFSDTGGSQSFSMAMLDGRSSGIVITSLYGRSSNRWFVKDIENGKGKGVELSKEEESAIRKAHTASK